MMEESIDIQTYPREFLEELFEHNIRTVHTKVHLLNWEERPLRSIEGIVKNGNYNVDGSSNVRRSLSLTFSVIDRDDQLVYKYLTADKKIQLYFGLENYTDKRQEEKIIWFNMGVFILTEPSYTHDVNTAEISITAQDKMSMLNGTLGGQLPMAVSFVERQNGKNFSFSWRDIFLSSAINLGNENPAKVVIDSVPDYINEYTQVKHVSGLKDDFIHVNAPANMEGERVIVRAYSPDIPSSEIPKQLKFSKGDRLYKLRRFGPPDPSAGTVSTQESYQKNIGEPVTSIFDDITEALGETHEYFYTREGDLIFQPIKNYINEIFDPSEDTELGYFKYELTMDDFIPNYLGLPFTYNFADKKTAIRYTNNPTFTNIKNDFIAVAETGEILEVAIDHRPSITEVRDWFKGVAADFNMNSVELDFLAKDGIRREPYKESTDTVFFEFAESSGANKEKYLEVPLDRIPWQIAHGLRNYYTRNIYGAATARILPRWGKECESLIFKYVASEDKKTLIPNTGIFNPSNIAAGIPWLSGYPVSQDARTENDVEELDRNSPIFSEKGDPSFWTYFLDIIPTESQLGQYSIELLGKRSISHVSKQATTMFRVNPKELVVLTEQELQNLGGELILQDLEDRGESYAVIKDMQNQYYKPAILNEKTDSPPYGQFGVSSNLEKLEFYIPLSSSSVKTYQGGGKFSGGVSINQNALGQGKEGMLTISPGVYLDPISKKQRESTSFGEILTPFVSEKDVSPYAFLMYVESKAKFANSGTHPFFIVAKNINDTWHYAKISGTSSVWTKFTIDPLKEIIVGVLEHTVYSYQEDGKTVSYGDVSISAFNDLFNIRDSNMENLFSVDGAVDLFSSIRTLLYRHTNTSDVVGIEVLPVYNLEPNTLIYAEDELSNISGMFMITGYSIQLGGGPTMSISAIQTNPRI